MTETAHDVQAAALLAALRAPAVAAAAGVGATPWASTTSPRVLLGDRAGYLAGLHRGRLPAVEVWQESDQWDRLTRDGGTLSSTWVLRAHVAELSAATAEARARAILLVAIATLRASDYTDEGEEAFGALTPGPLGHYLEARVGLVHVYDRGTYETDATVEEVGVSGGVYVLNFDDASPATVFTVPSGQALDNIEVRVVTAFDGVGASLILGTSGDPDAFLPLGTIDLATVASYEADFDDEGPVTIVATLDPSGSTAGQVRIQVTTTAGA